MSRVIVLFSLFASVATAQDYSGKWTWATRVGRGTSTRVLVLNQVGNDVLGTITPEDNRWTTGPFDGSIHGGKVDASGTLRFHVWFLRDEPVPQVFVGKMSPDNQAITFSVSTGEGFPPPLVKSLTEQGERNAVRPAPFKVTAKRTR